MTTTTTTSTAAVTTTTVVIAATTTVVSPLDGPAQSELVPGPAGKRFSVIYHLLVKEVHCRRNQSGTLLSMDHTVLSATDVFIQKQNEPYRLLGITYLCLSKSGPYLPTPEG